MLYYNFSTGAASGAGISMPVKVRVRSVKRRDGSNSEERRMMRVQRLDSQLTESRLGPSTVIVLEEIHGHIYFTTLSKYRLILLVSPSWLSMY